jgi:hypothetical protein
MCSMPIYLLTFKQVIPDAVGLLLLIVLLAAILITPKVYRIIAKQLCSDESAQRRELSKEKNYLSENESQTPQRDDK